MPKTTKYISDSIKSFMDGMDPATYATQESWDIQTACNALSTVACLVGSERDEPEDMAKLSAIMQWLVSFISGEIAQIDAVIPKEPAQLADKSADPSAKLDLSYAKSLGITVSESFLLRADQVIE